jgi:hypothetical protein
VEGEGGGELVRDVGGAVDDGEKGTGGTKSSELPLELILVCLESERGKGGGAKEGYII